MKVDLHIHTNKSDGAYSPEEIVDKAVEKSLGLIAITDHDTVLGAKEAFLYAKEASKPLDVIRGIELSTYLGDNQVHILGYNIDVDSPVLAAAIKKQKDARSERNRAMFEKLKSLGMELDYESILNSAKDTVGRKHIAEEMVKKGYVRSIGEAFNRYISEGAPAFVAGIRMKPTEGVELLKRVGGVVVLAHPCKIKLPRERLTELVAELKELGLDGMESDYFAQTQYMRSEMRRIANSLNLFITGGSDFHSDSSAVALGERNCRLSQRAWNALRGKNEKS